ncbi:uncharacterized protein LOC100898776 [Galendromus occidentalis]|uniref:Uncharacterized protein LOC100898776 n=1 Tax=Galendromus occidentalis TaxID=34638 RepID=A0AAJ6QQS9_9ACAR|nr:uncharacterized protein LOC100898776 [Galendromus occidentalis]
MQISCSVLGLAAVIAWPLFSSVIAGRVRRQSPLKYDLPDGADLIVGPYTTNFRCPETYGFFADVENNCRLFHLCHPLPRDNGNSHAVPIQVQHYTFFCGNETIFDQLSLSCSYPEDSIPCENSPDFFYLNDNFGSEGPSVTDEDLARVQTLVAKYDQTALNK